MTIDKDFFIENELPVPKEKESDVHVFVEEVVKSLFEENEGDYNGILAGLSKEINDLSPLDEKGEFTRIISPDDSRINQRQALIEYKNQLIESVGKTRNKTANVLEE